MARGIAGCEKVFKENKVVGLSAHRECSNLYLGWLETPILNISTINLA